MSGKELGKRQLEESVVGLKTGNKTGHGRNKRICAEPIGVCTAEAEETEEETEEATVEPEKMEDVEPEKMVATFVEPVVVTAEAGANMTDDLIKPTDISKSTISYLKKFYSSYFPFLLFESLLDHGAAGEDGAAREDGAGAAYGSRRRGGATLVGGTVPIIEIDGKYKHLQFELEYFILCDPSDISPYNKTKSILKRINEALPKYPEEGVFSKQFFEEVVDNLLQYDLAGTSKDYIEKYVVKVINQIFNLADVCHDMCETRGYYTGTFTEPLFRKIKSRLNTDYNEIYKLIFVANGEEAKYKWLHYIISHHKKGGTIHIGINIIDWVLANDVSIGETLESGFFINNGTPNCLSNNENFSAIFSPEGYNQITTIGNIFDSNGSNGKIEEIKHGEIEIDIQKQYRIFNKGLQDLLETCFPFLNMYISSIEVTEFDEDTNTFEISIELADDNEVCTLKLIMGSAGAWNVCGIFGSLANIDTIDKKIDDDSKLNDDKKKKKKK